MDTILIILTVAIVVVVLLAVFQFMNNQGKSQGVNIQTDENSKIHFSTQGSTLQIQITYESTENRPCDAFLFPDNDPLPPPAGALDRNFWLKVASYDELSREEQDEIDRRLEQSGFFRPEERSVADVMSSEDDTHYVEMIDNFLDDASFPGAPAAEEEEPVPEFSPEFTY